MKINIKTYLMVLTALFTTPCMAQITGNLILNNRPPSYLSDWNNAQTGQLILNFVGAGNMINVKIGTSLLNENGDAIGTSNIATARVIALSSGANIINIGTVLQLENMRFTGATNALAQSGKLTAGSYQLCVRLFTADNQPLQFDQCRPFTQVNFQLPYLLSPTDKFLIDANVAQTAIIFRWSSLVPATQEAPTYRLQVYEVNEAQTAMQALRANQPILATDLQRITQYIWRPQLSFNDNIQHIFIWTVQTLDSRGIPVAAQDANTQGRSEPRVFAVCNKAATTDSLNVCIIDFNRDN